MRPTRSMQISVCNFCNYLMFCCLEGDAELPLRRLPGRPATTKSMAAPRPPVYLISFFFCDVTEEREKKKLQIFELYFNNI